MRVSSIGQNEAVSQLQRGEEAGLSFFFNQHYKALSLFSVRITRNNEASEEVIEDAYLKLWDRRNDFSNPTSIRSFLYIVVKNASLTWLTQASRIRSYELSENVSNEPSSANILQDVIRAEIYAEVHAALAKLPPQCRRVMQMGFFEGRSAEEIAKELGLSPSTVRNQKKRGLGLLRGMLGARMMGLLLIFYYG